MIRSMTGFGKANCTWEGEEISLEVTSVNHRFLDCTFRMPYGWSLLEGTLKETLKQYIARGKVNIYIGRKRANGANRAQIQLDEAAARQYLDAAKQLAEVMSTTQALSLDVLAQMDGVFFQEEKEEDLEAVRTMLQELFVGALEKLNAMRAAEGAALLEDLSGRVDGMRASLGGIESALPEIGVKYEERLRARIRDLAADAGLAEERLALEVAMMADKADVTEEFVRLRAHFDHAAEHLAQGGPIGRELGFLAQEIQRELNTLGSKLRDAGVSRDILWLKAELEKLREQVQNVE